MADFKKIDSDLTKLGQQGAGRDVVEAYFKLRGVSPQEFKSWKEGTVKSEKPEMSWWEQGVSALLQVPQTIAGPTARAVEGQQDPAFAEVAKQPSIERASGIIDPQAEMVGVTDQAYGDIYQKNLGDRFISRQKDKYGYDVITFKGDDGSPQQAYVNKPGLDVQDVNRGLSQAVPYLMAAGPMGRLMKGAGAAANIATQAATAGLTSGIVDTTARGRGSTEAVDPWRMAIAMGGAGVGEFIGRLGAPLIRRLYTNKTLVDDAGKLTNKGRKLVQKQGLDPDLVDDETARLISERASGAKDPGEAVISAESDQFGIPTTRGQRTKDVEQLVDEERMRFGKYGSRAKEEITSFDQAQKKAIERAALGEEAGEGIAGTINPARPASEFTDDAIGEQITRGVRAADREANKRITAAWRSTENIEATPEAFKNLGGHVTDAIDDMRLAPTIHPTAIEMDSVLGDFVKRRGGQALKGDPPQQVGVAPKLNVIGQKDVRYVDETRRQLLKLMQGAPPGSPDKEAARRVYEGFDNWIKDSAEKQLLSGSPDAAQNLLNARKTTRELKGLFDPRKRGKPTAASKILNKLQDAETGEEALRTLLGASGVGTPIQAGGVKALTQFKKAALKLGGAEGKRAWDDVRLSFWLKTVRNNKGQMATPTTIANNIDAAFAKNPTLMKVLYNEQERRLIRQFQQSMKAVAYKDPNPSKSGIVMSPVADAAKTFLKGQGERERFVKGRILLANLYRQLARMVPDAAGMQDILGAPLARSATSQKVKQVPGPSLGGYGAALTPSIDRATEPNQPRNALVGR